MPKSFEHVHILISYILFQARQEQAQLEQQQWIQMQNALQQQQQQQQQMLQQSDNKEDDDYS